MWKKSPESGTLTSSIICSSPAKGGKRTRTGENSRRAFPKIPFSCIFVVKRSVCFQTKHLIAGAFQTPAANFHNDRGLKGFALATIRFENPRPTRSCFIICEKTPIVIKLNCCRIAGNKVSCCATDKNSCPGKKTHLIPKWEELVWRRGSPYFDCR